MGSRWHPRKDSIWLFSWVSVNCQIWSWQGFPLPFCSYLHTPEGLTPKNIHLTLPSGDQTLSQDTCLQKTNTLSRSASESLSSSRSPTDFSRGFTRPCSLRSLPVSPPLVPSRSPETLRVGAGHRNDKMFLKCTPISYASRPLRGLFPLPRTDTSPIYLLSSPSQATKFILHDAAQAWQRPLN